MPAVRDSSSWGVCVVLLLGTLLVVTSGNASHGEEGVHRRPSCYGGFDLYFVLDK